MKSSLGAESDRLLREHNDRAWLAWHIAALPRVKRFPKLQTMLAKQSSAPRRQSWQEQLRIMDAYAARTQRRAADRKE